MIANEIAVGKSFGENILYNVRGKSNDPNPEKCAWFEVRNLYSDDLDVAEKLMQATASKSKTDKPVYHFSLDWDKSEEPQLNQERATEAGDKLLKELGLAEHQAIYFWHTDADHPHMHIVVNRVHPETGKAHDMWKSKERLERGTHEIAREMNFLEVAGKHNELVWDGSLGKETETREQRMMREDLKPWDKAKVKSVKQDVSEFFFTADSWQTLGKNLNSKGLWLHKKGQGLIVTDGDGFTQLSKMGKKIRLKEMEQRFGEKWTDYEASQHKEFEALVAAESKTIANELQQEQSRDDAPLPDERFIEFQQIDHKLQDFERAQKVQKSAAMVLRTKGDIKRAEYLLGRAKELLTYHEDQFNQLLTKVYKDPEQAKERVAEVSKVGLLKETIWKGGKKRERWKRILEFLKLRKKHEIAKKRGKRIDKHKTRARRQAERLEYHVFYRLQKIRAAQGRLRNREDQLTQAKFNLVHREKDHEKEKITESYLLSLRKEALVKVPEKEILKSYDLTRREKAQLLAARNFALKEVEQDKGEDKDKGRDFER